MEGDVEIATFRSDYGYQDGRRPEEVRFESSPEADAQRRDFTINALFLDPETGEILDFVGGHRDLTSGIIRAIGDPEQRFREDYLRMLRAVRFAARLGFSIEPETARGDSDICGSSSRKWRPSGCGMKSFEFLPKVAQSVGSNCLKSSACSNCCCPRWHV